MPPSQTSKEEPLPLPKAVMVLLEECRMVLPGLQALFGFQLVAVFNSRFPFELSFGEQKIHLAAIALTALSAAIIMTPAAYHRQTHPQKVSDKLLRVATRLVLCSMPPLALSICMDFYLVSRLILHDTTLAAGATGVLALVLAGLWFVFPNLRRRETNDCNSLMDRR